MEEWWSDEYFSFMFLKGTHVVRMAPESEFRMKRYASHATEALSLVSRSFRDLSSILVHIGQRSDCCSIELGYYVFSYEVLDDFSNSGASTKSLECDLDLTEEEIDRLQCTTAASSTKTIC